MGDRTRGRSLSKQDSYLKIGRTFVRRAVFELRIPVYEVLKSTRANVIGQDQSLCNCIQFHCKIGLQQRGCWHRNRCLLTIIDTREGEDSKKAVDVRLF